MLVDLKFRPGLFRNGTRQQAEGRWYDSNLVRWYEGTVRPIGGWAAVQKTSPEPTEDLALSGVPRAVVAWRGNNGTAQLAVLTNTHAYAFREGVLTDITPVDLVTGDEGTSTGQGAYGSGLYGAFAYGVGDPAQGVVNEAATWQADTFGDYLVAVLSSDGRVLYWDRDSATDLVEATGAPTDCAGVVVTPERFLFALGADGDGRKVAWAAQETLDTWTPSSSNNAGDFLLEGNGRLRCGRRGKGETLLWTDDDLFAARYIGGSLIYGFERVGSACGVISPGAAVVVDGVAVWMGQKGFYTYDGVVRPLPCDLFDYVFGDFNTTQRVKVSAFPVTQFGEVWFCYPSAGSSENDRIVVWNYRENHWAKHEIARTCGADRGTFDNPILCDSDGAVLYHERGQDRGGEVAFLESGPLRLSGSESVVMVDRIIPDERMLGDVEFTLFGAMHPTETEEEYGPFTSAEPTDVRMSARQVRLRADEVNATSWRLGTVALRAKGRGRR